MKVDELIINNWMGIKALVIHPNEDLNLIQGKNGAGKTAVLNAIACLIGGVKELPEDPIRKGEKKANLEMTCDGYKFKLNITEKNSYLKVYKNNVEQKPTMEVINNLVGNWSFDPFRFLDLDPKEQRIQLMKLVGFDPDVYKKRIKELKEERHDVGVEGKTLKGQLAAYPLDLEAPEEKLDEDVLKGELSSIEEQKNNLADVQQAHKLKRNALVPVVADVKRLENELAEAQKKQETLTNEIKVINNNCTKLQEALPSEAEFSELQTKIKNVTEINKKVESNEKHLEIKDKVDAKVTEWTAKDLKIKELKQAEISDLEGVFFPVDGLGFGEDCITYNGIQIKQISRAEGMRVCIGISRALNPNLNVILVRDSTLMDDETIAYVKSLAKQDGKIYQLWMEQMLNKPEHSDEVGFYIEAGEIKDNIVEKLTVEKGLDLLPEELK